MAIIYVLVNKYLTKHYSQGSFWFACLQWSAEFGFHVITS